MLTNRQQAERREWERLPLAVPVFVRGVDERGAEFLEFTSALNVSAGGMLVALRHMLARSSKVRLEIPAAPAPEGTASVFAIRNLNARLVRVQEGPGWRLCGFRFTRPLLAT
jgi:hypothetical protein